MSIRKKIIFLASLILGFLATGFFSRNFVYAADEIGRLGTTSSLSVSATSSNAGEVFWATESSTRELQPEPVIRVGLSKAADRLEFFSEFPYEVFSGTQSQGLLPAGKRATLEYYNGVYIFKSDSLAFDSPRYFRLAPSDPANYFTLLGTFERRLKGRKPNFNSYRGTLEYRYSPRSKAVFVINELPLDEYVAGITESADNVPEEYAKALLIAARSYANAQISAELPTERRMFDVYASTVDQLYLGYNSEISMPRIAAAAALTAGQMVTYQGNPVVTPYFSHSNGKTKNWKNTPGGADRPWLQSVPAVYDKGKKMSGHGIGMSNHDAMQRAKKDNWTYKQILKYYYTDVEVERVY